MKITINLDNQDSKRFHILYSICIYYMYKYPSCLIFFSCFVMPSTYWYIVVDHNDTNIYIIYAIYLDKLKVG